jgi:hypothetical protein
MAATIPPSIVPSGAAVSTTGIPAFGTQIQVLSQASPAVYTTIAGVGDITGPNTALAETETTSHSTGVAHRTYIPTLIDDGDISFPCYFNPSDPTHSLFSPYGLENLFQNRAVTKWRLVNTDPTKRTREFSGFVNKLGEKYPVAGVCTRRAGSRDALADQRSDPDSGRHGRHSQDDHGHIHRHQFLDALSRRGMDHHRVADCAGHRQRLGELQRGSAADRRTRAYGPHPDRQPELYHHAGGGVAHGKIRTGDGY